MLKTIEVVAYNADWPNVFQTEAARIQKALANNCAAIHHIGSTSVPGLAAKPIIDIIVVVKDLTTVSDPIGAMGYQHKGEYNIPMRAYFSNKTMNNPFQLHVYEEFHPEIELNLCFRDYLRNFPNKREEYARLKEALVADESSFQKQKGSMFSGYNLGKDRFIRQILKTSGYKRHRLLKVAHLQEWEDYHRIRKTEIFDPIGVVYDPHHPSISSSSAHHFILCHGTETRTVAHIEFLNGGADVALRSLATDARFQRQGYGAEMMSIKAR